MAKGKKSKEIREAKMAEKLMGALPVGGMPLKPVAGAGVPVGSAGPVGSPAGLPAGPLGSSAPSSMPSPDEIPEKVKKEIEKVKAKVEKFAKVLLKQHPYFLAVGLMPALPPLPGEPQQQQKKKPKPELIIVFPDEKLKQIKQIEKKISDLVKKHNVDVNFITRSPKELWQMSFDGHYADVERIAMAFPLSDKGILGALRVAAIHKNLVLRKFEKYVVSYVIAGSLVRGQATKTSDVDVYVVIDDTDVKRMSRIELKEKLRGIIISYAFEANKIAAAKNKLSPQIYILTDFWESVKDAHPVIFTFIRDGVPLYDRGAFMPWKLLLRMGKIKPSPEAIDTFMALGEKVKKRVCDKLNFIVTEDIYWGVITPSQAALMLYGLPPPTPLDTIKLMDKVFVKKEKLLEKKYVNILEKIVKAYKQFEHGKLKDVKGADIDVLLKETEAYIKRLKKLVEQIEKRVNEKTVMQLYEDCFELLGKVLGKAGATALVEKFKNTIIKRGEMSPRNLQNLREVQKAKADYKKGKLTKQEIERVRRDAREFIDGLSEYAQRKELISLEKSRVRVRVGKELRELYLFGDVVFLISQKKEVEKLNLQAGRVEKSNLDELAVALRSPPKKVELNATMLKQIGKILGKEVYLLF